MTNHTLHIKNNCIFTGDKTPQRTSLVTNKAFNYEQYQSQICESLISLSQYPLQLAPL